MDLSEIYYIERNPFNYGVREVPSQYCDPHKTFQNTISTQANRSICCIAKGYDITVFVVVLNFSLNWPSSPATGASEYKRVLFPMLRNHPCSYKASRISSILAKALSSINLNWTNSCPTGTISTFTTPALITISLNLYFFCKQSWVVLIQLSQSERELLSPKM